MKTTAILTALTIGITSVAATCYKSGDSWPSREEARSFVYDACYSNGGMFTGGYAPLQLKTMCPHSGGLGLLFEVENLNNREGFDLGNDDCYNRLTDEIFACEHGGDSTISGWRFRADPGNC